MDNGAYAKYRQENPIVSTFLTTYEHITLYPEQLTNEEIVLLVTLPTLALYAVVKLIYEHFFKKKNLMRLFTLQLKAMLTAAFQIRLKGLQPLSGQNTRKVIGIIEQMRAAMVGHRNNFGAPVFGDIDRLDQFEPLKRPQMLPH